jgi:hypothetical protein
MVTRQNANQWRKELCGASRIRGGRDALSIGQVVIGMSKPSEEKEKVRGKIRQQIREER